MALGHNPGGQSFTEDEHWAVVEFSRDNEGMTSQLPSERYEPGSMNPVGFVDEPDHAHVAGAAHAIAEVASVMVPNRTGVNPLAVEFCHYKHNPLLSPRLFGFAVHEFDQTGNWIDPVASGRPVSYAINLNLPVDLQREVALAFLAQLIMRQLSDRKRAAEVDELVAAEDNKANQLIRDGMRYGWKHVAGLVADLAKSGDLALAVSYRQDPLPYRDQVVSRFPVLREAYNEVPALHTVIDRAVTRIGMSGHRIAGGSEGTREWLQARAGIVRWQEYLNQSTRDAQVFGNGFVRFVVEPPPTLHCLHPSDVEVARNGEFYRRVDQGLEALPDKVLHLRGIEQFDSPYGLSVLEPILPSYVTLRTITHARDRAFEFLSTEGDRPEVQEWARDTSSLYQRASATFAATVESMYYLPLVHWKFDPDHLYFEGQELLR